MLRVDIAAAAAITEAAVLVAAGVMWCKCV